MLQVEWRQSGKNEVADMDEQLGITIMGDDYPIYLESDLEKIVVYDHILSLSGLKYATSLQTRFGVWLSCLPASNWSASHYV